MTANEEFKQVLKRILNACNGLSHVLKLSIQCNAVHFIKNVFVVSFYVTDAIHWLETPTTGAGRLAG
jgi:homospermidine synthase